MKKIIRYYRKQQYGVDREFLHPTEKPEYVQAIHNLTKQATINEFIRHQIEVLTDGQIVFMEVIAPKH
jgi:hypothetical protein